MLVLKEHPATTWHQAQTWVDENISTIRHWMKKNFPANLYLMEDLLQEAYLIAHKCFNEYGHSEAARYIWSSLRFYVLSEQTRFRTESDYAAENSIQTQIQCQIQEQHLEHDEAVDTHQPEDALITSILELMSPAERRIIEMRFANLSNQEIANKLQIQRESTYKTNSRAVARLKRFKPAVLKGAMKRNPECIKQLIHEIQQCTATPDPHPASTPLLPFWGRATAATWANGTYLHHDVVEANNTPKRRYSRRKIIDTPLLFTDEMVDE